MSEYYIGTFNCKNFIYDNDKEKFDWILEIIKKTEVDMLLLQEFAAKNKSSIKLPNGWDIVLYHGKWFTKDFKDTASIVTDFDIDLEDDTNKEYMRKPNNDNGYAILWNTKKFELRNFQDVRSVQNLFTKRNTNKKLARPPQIEFFSTKSNENNILAVMNTHLTFRGKFSLYVHEIPIQGAYLDEFMRRERIHDYSKASKEVKSRVNEMSELLQLYETVNNQGFFGVHYTTIIGGDFNLPVTDLRCMDNTPEGFPSTTMDYNNIKRNGANEEYNIIYAENENKTTLHKLYRDDYKYHSYDHFIINKSGCKTKVFDSVRELKDFYDESNGDKSPKNDEHYNKLSDHLPVVITVNL